LGEEIFSGILGGWGSEMRLRHIRNTKKPIGEILKKVGPEGLLLEVSKTRFAVIPLDDDLIDNLIERSPKFIEECKKIRKQMKAGKFLTHEEVKKALQMDLISD
jgi:hypothetical protein